MTKKLESASMEEWGEEFFLGIFSWAIIPLYFGFVTIVAVGISMKFAMHKTNEMMRNLSQGEY